jgi:hypothetical protein
MKHSTLVTKLLESLRTNPAHVITLGEISLALETLERAKEQGPALFAKLEPELLKLLPADS